MNGKIVQDIGYLKWQIAVWKTVAVVEMVMAVIAGFCLAVTLT